MRKVPAGLVAVLMLVGLAAACGGDDSTVASESTTTTATKTTEPNTVSVTASNFAFSPSTATAKAGQVYFEVKNEDSTKHTFTIDGTDVDIKLDAGASGEKEADLDAGTYEWHCTIHSSMTGTLTVS
jgi:plastocyanin